MLCTGFIPHTVSAQYKVAVADIMILKRQKIGAIQLSKELGADGVEVDMGGLGDRPTFDNKLMIIFFDNMKRFMLLGDINFLH